MLGGDGASGEDTQAWSSGKGRDGNEADVGCSGCKLVGTLGGEHPVEFVALCEFGGERRMFEVPHEGRGIEEADGGDAKLLLRS